MNSLEKEFVPYQESLELKELAFDEPCFATWVGERLDMSLQVPSDDYFTSAPTYSQAFRWFRDKYNLTHRITMSSSKFIFYDITEVKEHNHKSLYSTICSLDGTNTYEEAELACLKKLIEIVKNKKP